MPVWPILLLAGAAVSATLLAMSSRSLYRGIALSANTLCLAGIARVYQAQRVGEALALLGIASAIYSVVFLSDRRAEGTAPTRWPSRYAAYEMALFLWGVLCAALVLALSPWEVLASWPKVHTSLASGYPILLLFAGVALSTLALVAWLRSRGEG
jgi:hypothetical protein